MKNKRCLHVSKQAMEERGALPLLMATSEQVNRETSGYEKVQMGGGHITYYATGATADSQFDPD